MDQWGSWAPIVPDFRLAAVAEEAAAPPQLVKDEWGCWVPAVRDQRLGPEEEIHEPELAKDDWGNWLPIAHDERLDEEIRQATLVRDDWGCWVPTAPHSQPQAPQIAEGTAVLVQDAWGCWMPSAFNSFVHCAEHCKLVGAAMDYGQQDAKAAEHQMPKANISQTLANLLTSCRPTVHEGKDGGPTWSLLWCDEEVLARETMGTNLALRLALEEASGELLQAQRVFEGGPLLEKLRNRPYVLLTSTQQAKSTMCSLELQARKGLGTRPELTVVVDAGVRSKAESTRWMRSLRRSFPPSPFAVMIKSGRADLFAADVLHVVGQLRERVAEAGTSGPALQHFDLPTGYATFCPPRRSLDSRAAAAADEEPVAETDKPAEDAETTMADSEKLVVEVVEVSEVPAASPVVEFVDTPTEDAEDSLGDSEKVFVEVAEVLAAEVPAAEGPAAELRLPALALKADPEPFVAGVSSPSRRRNRLHDEESPASNVADTGDLPAPAAVDAVGCEELAGSDVDVNSEHAAESEHSEQRSDSGSEPQAEPTKGGVWIQLTPSAPSRASSVNSSSSRSPSMPGSMPDDLAGVEAALVAAAATAVEHEGAAAIQAAVAEAESACAEQEAASELKAAVEAEARMPAPRRVQTESRCVETQTVLSAVSAGNLVFLPLESTRRSPQLPLCDALLDDMVWEVVD